MSYVVNGKETLNIWKILFVFINWVKRGKLCQNENVITRNSR